MRSKSYAVGPPAKTRTYGVVHVVAPAPREKHTVCGARIHPSWTIRRPRGGSDVAPVHEWERLCKSCDRMQDADTMYGSRR